MQPAAYSLQPAAHCRGGGSSLSTTPPDIHPQRTKSTPLCVVHPARRPVPRAQTLRALARNRKPATSTKPGTRVRIQQRRLLQLYKRAVSSYPLPRCQNPRRCSQHPRTSNSRPQIRPDSAAAASSVSTSDSTTTTASYLQYIIDYHREHAAASIIVAASQPQSSSTREHASESSQHQHQ